MEAGEEPKDVTSNEEKELRRVYDHLANFSPKYKLRKRMQPLLDRKQKIMQFKRNPDAIRIVDEAGVELTPEQLDKELEHIEGEIDTLRVQIDEIDADPTKKIHCVDLMDALHSLGKDSTKVSRDGCCRRCGPPHNALSPRARGCACHAAVRSIAVLYFRGAVASDRWCGAV